MICVIHPSRARAGSRDPGITHALACMHH
eukprot:SAG11_NODE_39338_length_234_cov_125.792593_1_plen_28_part_01